MRSSVLFRKCTTAFLLPVWISGIVGLPEIAEAQSQPPAAATPIQHVVVIYQENVSFDHYFATYPNAANSSASEPVFTPDPATPSVNGLNSPLLTANPNSMQPVRLGRAQAVTCDQDHNYLDEQKAMNGGPMDIRPLLWCSSRAVPESTPSL